MTTTLLHRDPTMAPASVEGGSPAPPWVEVLSHLDPRYGGLSAAVPGLARNLMQLDPEHRVNTSIAAFCAPGEHFLPAGFPQEQVHFWPASRKAWSSLRFRDQARDQARHQAPAAANLRQAFRRQLQNAQGVHIHGLWEQSTALAAATARALGLPYVVSAHGMLEPWALANSRLKKLVYGHLVERNNLARATILHALTDAEAAQYRRFGARCPIAIIPNAVEIPAHPSATLFLRHFPALEGKRILLFMGRLHRKKGLDPLLAAWASVAPRFPEAHLVLAGPDAEGTQARLESVIAQHRLASSVTFTGMLADQMKWSALAAAEAFILPSFSEGLSVAILEAMGMGLPVIVTRACNMPQVETSAAGWQIDPTLSSLVTTLTQLFEHTSTANRETGARGANLIQTRYTWPIVARQMAEVYRWAAGGSQPQNVEVVHAA